MTLESQLAEKWEMEALKFETASVSRLKTGVSGRRIIQTMMLETQVMVTNMINMIRKPRTKAEPLDDWASET